MAKKYPRKTTDAICDAIEVHSDGSVNFVYEKIIRYGHRWLVIYSVEGTVKEYYISIVLEYKGKFGVENSILISTEGR